MVSPKFTDNRRIRIALVGCGRISRNHIKAIYLHYEKAELAALCDTEQNRIDSAQNLVNEISKEYPGTSSIVDQFIGYENLLGAIKNNDIEVDLVVLTTPSGLHPSQAISAAALGLHVCTEKPMATRWQDGLEMVKACEKAEVRLFVVKQNRFNSTLQLVKRQLEAGRFGQLSMISINVFWQRPQSYYDTDKWRGTWELDGGALMNQASHYVDLLDWLAGPVESLSASIATLGRNIEAEDTAVLQLRWRNGALGTMAVTMLTYPENLEGSITLLGEKGTVKVGGPAVNQIERWVFGHKTSDDDLVNQASYETTSVYGFGHPKYYDDMLDCLKSGTQAMCDGYEGLKSLEILEGAYLSARSEKRIFFPLKTS